MKSNNSRNLIAPATSKHWLRLAQLWLCTLLLGFQLPLVAQQASSPPPQPLSDKAWGTVLFEFYQQNYRRGLIQLAQAKHQGLGQHQSQALVAEGGMSLVYGLTHHAEQILQQLAQSQQPETQAQAWFWLAKSYFDSGQWVSAQQALHNTQNWRAEYQPIELEQLAYMQGQIYLNQGNLDTRHQQLTSALKDIPKGSAYRPYLHYNLGISLLNSGQLANAILALQQAKTNIPDIRDSHSQHPWWTGLIPNWLSADTTQIQTLEAQGLKDRVHLAMGYTYLNKQDHQQALNEFANIHHQRQDAATALLGYAQALINQQQIPLALAIWQKISQDHPASISALQALLAMAWQLEQAGDEQQAWQTLAIAQSQLASAKQDVSYSVKRIQQPGFIQQLVPTRSDELALASLQSWPKSQRDIVQAMLAGQSKQQLQQWLELHQEYQQLNTQKQDITGFKQLLNERQQTAIARAGQVAQHNFVQRVENLKNRLQQLTQQVETAETEQNGSLFATDTQSRQLARIEKAKQRLARIQKSKDLSPKYAQRLARLEGRLTWYFADNFQPLLWQHKKAISEAQQLLTITENSSQSLRAHVAKPATFSQEHDRVHQLEKKLNRVLNTIKQLQDELRQTITDSAKQTLMARVDDLAKLEQTIKLAQLRLQDKDPQALPLSLTSTTFEELARE